MGAATYKPMSDAEVKKLSAGLRGNAEKDWAMLMGKDTSFEGVAEDLPTDEEVISAVKSIPCHY